MSNEVKPVYKCTEDALYEITRRATGNLKTDRLDFFAKSTNYTAIHVTDLEGLRTTAMGLPNEDQRSATHETTRNLLPGLVEPIKLNFRALQGYIRDGWPTEDPNPRYEEAGLLKYNAIRGSNWEAVVGLQDMMVDFVGDAANLAKITTPGGMPAGFVAQLGTDYSPFDTAYTLFAATVDTTTARNAKVTANNTLTTECKKFMKFGREVVYPKDKGMKERYTWEIIQKQVEAHFAGMHVKVMSAMRDVPIANVQFTWKPEGKPAVTWTSNDKGVGEKEFEAGKGKLIAAGTGLLTVEQEFTIEPGVKKRVNLSMQDDAGHPVIN